MKENKKNIKAFLHTEWTKLKIIKYTLKSVIMFFLLERQNLQMKHFDNYAPVLVFSFVHAAFYIKTLLTSLNISTQGEAKSAELIGMAISDNPAFLALRKIEAAREISHTIAQSSNKVFLDSQDLLLNLHSLNVEVKKVEGKK